MNRHNLPILAASLLLLAAGPPHPPAPVPLAPANPVLQKAGTGFTFEDWHVSTDQLDYNWSTGIFTVPVRLTLTRPGSDITADRANGNSKLHLATLVGNVVLHDNNGVLTNFAGQTGSHVPATLTCDTLNIEGTKKRYTATGNVYFKQGSTEIRSRRAVMDGITHEIHLSGDVQLTQ